MLWPSPLGLQPSPIHKRKKKRKEKQSSSHQLPIGVRKRPPPALFKEGIPTLSLSSENPKSINGNRQKIITEDQLCARLIFTSKSFTGIEDEPPPLPLFSSFLSVPVCTIIDDQSHRISLRKKSLFLPSFL